MKKILVFILIIGCSISNAQQKVDVEKQLGESKKEVYKLLEDFDRQLLRQSKGRKHSQTPNSKITTI